MDGILGSTRDRFSTDAVNIDQVKDGDIDLTTIFDGQKYAKGIWVAGGGVLVVSMPGKNASAKPVTFVLGKGMSAPPGIYTRILKATTCSGITVFE